MKNKQFFVMLILSFAFLPTAGFVNAQEEVGIIIQNAPVPELLEMDESVAPQDLGVGEPTILPDNPFYFFKNTFRGLRSTFTFNSERKAELKLRFANEKIIEAGKLAEKGNFKALERHLESYEKDIKSAGAKAKPEKFFEDNFKHQLLLGKFEKEAPVETAAGIKEVRAKFPNIGISIDGGVDDTNYKELFEIGATRLIVGSHFEKLWKQVEKKY